MTASRFDPQPPDHSAAGADRSTAPSNMGVEAGAPEGVDLLQLIGRAEQISRDYQQRTIQRPLSRAYRAWHNEHAEGSKYLGTAWRGRSRLFVPKTRSAVRKNLATMAAALFSTEDVVNIQASYEDDDQQRATAATIKADLDYRLTRSGSKSGMPWFLTAMGGGLDAQLTGIVVSKQWWEYEEVDTGKHETILVPVVDVETWEPKVEPVTDPATGFPVLDETGNPKLAPVMEEGLKPIMRVVKDRPMVSLVPIENIGVDPAAPWYSPVQGGRWWLVRYAMGMSDLKAWMASNDKAGNMAWLDVPDELLSKGRIDDDRSGSRRVREQGSDRYQDARIPGDLDIVWIQENFVRISGIDYHFWSIGRHGYLSKVRETHEAYPEYDGERPYHMGFAQLDTHRVFPMSPVESWQPLQLELNDITNLRQDTLKRSIAPLAVVKRGKNVDLTQVQRRGQPDAILMADDPVGDVVFQQTPGPSGAAYTETSVNNAMFDELAGVFSTSSVQSNRQLNETVGGMRLMSGAANAVSEFDLRIWVETWVEPVLRQLSHLVRFYESDEKVLAIAGRQARIWTRLDYLPTLDDFEQAEITLRVNAGIGALDPMQKLAKLKMAGEMLMPMYQGMKEKGITFNYKAFIDEVMGQAGFRDGHRFFEFGDPPQQQQDPEAQKFMAEMQLEREKMQVTFKEAMLELQSKERIDTADNRTKLQIESMRGKREVVKQAIGAHASRQESREARAHDFAAGQVHRRADREDTHTSREADRKDAEAARAHETGQRQQAASAQHRQRIQEILSGRPASNGTAKGGAAPIRVQQPTQTRTPTRAASADPALESIMERLDAQGKMLEQLMSQLVAGREAGQVRPEMGMSNRGMLIPGEREGLA